MCLRMRCPHGYCRRNLSLAALCSAVCPPAYEYLHLKVKNSGLKPGICIPRCKICICDWAEMCKYFHDSRHQYFLFQQDNFCNNHILGAADHIADSDGVKTEEEAPSAQASAATPPHHQHCNLHSSLFLQDIRADDFIWLIRFNSDKSFQSALSSNSLISSPTFQAPFDSDS